MPEKTATPGPEGEDEATEPIEKSHGKGEPSGRYLALLCFTALGVVYGDIGTSPLYAIRECFHGPHAVAVTRGNVLGVLSLIFWSLVIVISLKYLALVLRADNKGEGGILALASLVTPVRAESTRGRKYLLLLGLFGAALLYGDGMITPAISVLSAVEGLEIATPFLEPYVIPITIVILIGLFLLQSRGTSGVGKMFAPVTMIWFVIIAILGVTKITVHPDVLFALNPYYGAAFFAQNGLRGFLVLGAVFLVVTGGEALYADLGHFGAKPIKLTWYFFVLPALLMNYFGQGALLLSNPALAENPFYRMVPEWAIYPMVGLAAMATVIASQAVISGAFSLTMQAIQLGYSPRLEIDHTSPHEIGQIYLPGINWALMIACIGLVLGFQSSSALAAAYGVAVTTTMVITTLLLFVVMKERWHWALPAAVTVCAFFLVIDLAFFGANVLKIPDGGWFPLVIAAIVFTLMSTWKTGRRILRERLQERILPLRTFLDDLEKHPIHRVPGTAIFMYSDPEGTPPALLHNLKHNKVLHERVVILSVETHEIPHIDEHERVDLQEIGKGFYRVIVRYGFMEDPNIPKALKRPAAVLALKPMETTYFLGQERLIATPKPGMAIWRERLFAWMTRNARPATTFFCLPPNRVVELGAQIEL